MDYKIKHAENLNDTKKLNSTNETIIEHSHRIKLERVALKNLKKQGRIIKKKTAKSWWNFKVEVFLSIGIAILVSISAVYLIVFTGSYKNDAEGWVSGGFAEVFRDISYVVFAAALPAIMGYISHSALSKFRKENRERIEAEEKREAQEKREAKEERDLKQKKDNYYW